MEQISNDNFNFKIITDPYSFQYPKKKKFTVDNLIVNSKPSENEDLEICLIDLAGSERTKKTDNKG